MKTTLTVLTCSTSKEWEKWLAKNHTLPEGTWLRFFKKASGVTSITYAEALDVALCYGWIDGQVKKYDDKSWIQRFTPRRPRSLWSKRNIENVKRLTKLGKIKPSGKKQIEAAKADGRWKNAYDSPSTAKVPQDFMKELSKHKNAENFFKSLDKTNIYAIVWRLQTATKTEIRKKRMAVILGMLEKGKKFHEK